MNNKDIFYLFLKHADVIVSRYKELTKPPVRFVTSRERECFDLNFAKSQQEIAKMGNSAYHCYFEKEGKEKYGVFAHIPLYKYTKWDIEIIDQYKDKLVWLLLLEYGDFLFEEEILERYAQYIPWADFSSGVKQHIPISDTCYSFKSGTTLSNFKNIGKLSYEFIASHISVIDIFRLCSTGYFDVTIDLLNLLSNNCLLDECIGRIANNQRISISYEVLYYIAKELQVINWKDLLISVPLEDMTPERLFSLHYIDNNCLCTFIKEDFDKRRKIINLISNSKFYNEIDLTMVKKIWQGEYCYTYYNTYFGSYGQHFKDLPSTYDFSKELIEQYLNSWNQQSYEYFDYMQRTPDTNYKYYNRLTVWDILSNEKTLLLTYDLCKYLMSINVMVGGYYIIEDRDYLAEDVPNYLMNALKLFRFRDIINDEEFDKIIHDESIIDFLLTNSTKTYDNKNYVTGVIVDKLILKFFSDFSFEKFQELSLMYKK